MANSWQEDEEDEEFILKEPIFQEPKTSNPSSKPMFHVPISRTILDAAIIMGVFVGTYALAVITERMISKWLD